MSATIGTRSIGTVFGLERVDENSATHALGYMLARSPSLQALFGRDLLGLRTGLGAAQVSMQRRDRDLGFTDLEIRSDALHCIIEAKQGWVLPTLSQLGRYAGRLQRSDAARVRLITLSAASRDYARRHTPAALSGIPVEHLSWGEIRACVRRARARTRMVNERFMLAELEHHLSEFEAMDTRSSNKVFVVSLGLKPMVRGKSLTWIDVVEKQHQYFHPVGSHWPKTPPNYIGFRYHGRLQSVHHIESFDVARDLRTKHPEWPRTKEDHFIYRLGPAMKPASIVRTGKLYMNARVECDIDTLLSGACATVSEARDETQRRRIRED